VHIKLPTALIALALFLTTSFAALPSRAASGPDVAHFTLANGMEVIVIPDHRTPVVTHMVWYRVGSADETPGKSGLAHFLEHLMFKGTDKNPTGRFSQTVATIGGQENAFTSTDYTAYFQRATREHLPMLMDFEADRMTGLVLTDDVVKPELQVVLEEWNQRIGNSPQAQINEQIEAALYLNHPYGRPVIGWHQEIESLTRQDALDFYKRFYTPNNAILVVAGDVTAEEVKKLAESTYGKVQVQTEIRPRQRPQEPDTRAVRRLTFAHPRVEQPTMQRAYLAPSYTTAKPGEAEALEVLAFVLGGGSTSRLYRILVEEKGLATSAGAWYQGSALDASHFGVSGSPRPGVDLPKIEEAIDAVLAEVIEKGIDPQELIRAKTRLVAHQIYDQDNQSRLARLYGSAVTTGLTVEAVRDWPDRIKAVTADDVKAAARKFLDKGRSVTGYLIKETATRLEEKRS
jgi:zinc protease